MATLVETSMESASLPKMNGAVKQPWGGGEGEWSDPPRVPDPPDPLEALLLASIILCAGLIRYASLITLLGC